MYSSRAADHADFLTFQAARACPSVELILVYSIATANRSSHELPECTVPQHLLSCWKTSGML